jgi:hypothetical protein
MKDLRANIILQNQENMKASLIDGTLERRYTKKYNKDD